jgi:hypothetical protein
MALMRPNRFHITVRRPSPGDVGEICEGFYTYANGLVVLCDNLGEPLPGSFNTKLQEGEQPLAAARQLLRQQRSLNRHARFNGPIRYPPRGFV